VQAALDGLRGHAEHLGDLWGRQSLDVSEQQHLAVTRIERSDRSFDRSFEFLVRERFVG
jgi:hypothetical protein